MRRVAGRAVLVLLVASLATVAGAVHPAPAVAQVTLPPFEDLRSGNTGYLDDFYKKILHDSERTSPWHTQTTGSNAGKNVIYKQSTKARIAARLLPGFSTFATRATLVGGGAYLGWTIYQNFSGADDDEVDLWLDSDALGSDSLFNPCAAPPMTNCNDPANMFTWDGVAYGQQGDSSGTGLAFLTSWQREVGAVWMLSYSTASSNGGCFTGLGGPSPPCWVLHLNPAGYKAIADSRDGTWHGAACTAAWMGLNDKASSCWPLWSDADTYGVVGSTFPNETQATWEQQWPRQLGFAVEQTQNQILASVPGATGIITETHSPGVKRRAVVMTTGAMQGLTDDLLDSPNLGNPTETHTYNVPSPYTGPDTVGSTTDTQEALDVFDSPCGRAFVNWVLDPSTYTFNADACGGWNTATQTFPLLQPLVNETYAEYVTRLQAEGWLGSYTAAEALAGQEVPAMGPEGVVSVRIGQNLYRVGAWPSPLPQWNVNSSLSLRYNPDTVPPGDGDGEPLPPGEGGVGLPPLPTGPLGEWCPSCPPVDFGPLTEVDYGDSFPFGLVTWLGDQLSLFSTTADAPVFSFDFDHIGVSEDYVVDLDVMDDYMSIIRTILSWCIWIGGLWWFGSRLLGFRETGDPGQAVDDAW